MGRGFLGLARLVGRLLRDPPGKPRRRRAESFFFLLTVLVDMIAVVCCLGLAAFVRQQLFRMGLTRGDPVGFVYRHFLPAAVYYCAGMYFMLKYVDVYRPRRFLTGNRELGRVLHAVWIFTLWNALLGYFLRNQIPFSALTVGAAGALMSVAVPAGRFLLDMFRRRLRGNDLDIAKALVVGTGPAALDLAAELVNERRYGYHVIGFLDPEREEDGEIDGIRVYGGPDRLEKVLRLFQPDCIFVVEPDWDARRVTEFLRDVRDVNVEVRVASDIFRFMVDRVHAPVDSIDGTPIMDFSHRPRCRWRSVAKRIIDMVVSALLLVLGLPIWILTALAVVIESGRPVIVSQTRIGRGGKPFTFYKFRSMVVNAEELGEDLGLDNERDGPVFKIKADPRITRVGAFIRRYSLDEAPQLWNVLKGDMSLVGPRPPLPREVEQYEDWQMSRLDGPVGLSGLWQVSGRAELSFEEMLCLDIYYLANQSLFLDYRILARTLNAVFLGQGAY